jgi:hypothetical protein
MPKANPDIKKSARIAASQSFSLEEIELLDFTYETLLKSGNPVSVTRAKVFPKLLRKIKTMRARAQTVKNARSAASPVAAE